MYHHFNVIRILQRNLRGCAGIVSRLVQDLVHFLFKRLLHRHPRLRFQLAVLCEFDHRFNITLRLGDGIVNSAHGTVIGNRIDDTARETVV